MRRRTPRTVLGALFARGRRPRPGGPPGLLAATAVLALTVTLVAPAGRAAAEPQATDLCAGQCADILPPGTNGSATLAEILAHRVLGVRPPHANDQLGRYDALSSDYPTLTDDALTRFFDDASFGVPEDQVASVVRPRADVRITRDKEFGIPHVQGTTRYGAGYAAGQDRLWLIDLFRHVGRGELTSFAGGAAANQDLEQQFWPQAPYTEEDLRRQVDFIRTHGGARGEQAMADAQAYVDGLNAYRVKAKNDRTFPGEYDLTGKIDPITNVGEIEPFTVTDMIALASVVGALFGNGGGGEVDAALSLLAAQRRYGTEEGTRVWESFRQRNDPEAVLTVHDGSSFPYAGRPDDPRGTALPDPGSVRAEQLVYDRTGSAEQGAEATKDPVEAPRRLAPLQGVFDHGVLPADLFARHGDGSAVGGMSNALLVSGAHTASGHPVAVFGPQTGYFAPQLLMMQELQGPGISARGVSFAGIGMYVQLGRGQDYAWSATTAAQDIIDTYAVQLCEPDGSEPTTDATHYLRRGTCTPMEKLERTNSWKPTIADSTAAGSYRLQVYRTAYGIVTHRATVDGRPVAYTLQRSTYRHEADSIIGFQMLNDPSYVTDAHSFQRAAAHINYTFNWFYADFRDIAYFNSGANPVRAAGVDPSLPVKAEPAYEWRDFDFTDNTAAYTPDTAHPQSVDQDYYVSWNNKQAADYSAASFSFGAVHRADLLDARVKRLTARGGVTRASLTGAMAEAAVTDLRGERVLPALLEVLRSSPIDDPKLAEAVQRLEGWRAAGAPRRETEAGSHTYAHADAVRIMDAWWPLLVEAEFRPGLGDDLWEALTRNLVVDEPPSAGHGATGGHAGSAFQYGWWGHVDKDLRAVLGRPVDGPLGRTYCGDGKLDACRDVLLTTLGRAAATPASTVYSGDDTCEAGDQWCADAIVQRPLGGITHEQIQWQNRPTYQQVVEFPKHR